MSRLINIAKAERRRAKAIERQVAVDEALVVLHHFWAIENPRERESILDDPPTMSDDLIGALNELMRAYDEMLG